METYIELKTRQSEEFNEFPMVFAFSKKQFKSGMEKLGLTETDTDKVYSVPGGGFVRKTDSRALSDLFLRHNNELTEAMKNPDFAYTAFNYELNNHEYCITGDVSDTLGALGVDLEEVEASPIMKEALAKAKKHQPRG